MNFIKVILTLLISLQIQGSYITLLNQNFTQSQDFDYYSINLADYAQKISEVQIYVELSQISTPEQGASMPLLIYFTNDYPFSIQNLKQTWIQEVSLMKQSYYYDNDGALHNKTNQYLLISQNNFPLNYRQRYNQFPLILQQNQSINLGVLRVMPIKNQILNYNLLVRLSLTKADQQQNCPGFYNQINERSCNEQGLCSSRYNICKCDTNHFNADCSNEFNSVQYNQDYKINVSPYAWQYQVTDLDKASSADTFSIQVQSIEVSGAILFSYGCLNGENLLPNLQNYQNNFINIDANQQILLQYSQQDIQDCQQITTQTSQKLGILLKSQLILAFYNPQLSISSSKFIVSLSQTNEFTLNTNAIYISAIFLGIVLIVVVGFLCKKYQSRNVLQVVPQDGDRVVALEKKQLAKKRAYNKYMPLITYAKIIEEYPDLKEITECLVCLVPFEPQDRLRTTPCFHIFHKKCIDKWLKHHENCPFCRATLDKKSMREAAKNEQQQQYSDGSIQILGQPQGNLSQSGLENNNYIGSPRRSIDGQTSMRNSNKTNSYVQRIKMSSQKNIKYQRRSSGLIPDPGAEVKSKEAGDNASILEGFSRLQDGNSEYSDFPSIDPLQRQLFITKLQKPTQIHQQYPQEQMQDVTFEMPKNTNQRTQIYLGPNRQGRSFSQQNLISQIDTRGGLEQIDEDFTRENNQSRQQQPPPPIDIYDFQSPNYDVPQIDRNRTGSLRQNTDYLKKPPKQNQRNNNSRLIQEVTEIVDISS